MKIPFFLHFLMVAGSAWGVGIFVSPSGDDANAGTIDLPKRTIQSAVEAAFPGDVIEIRAGVYRELIRPIRSGTESQPIEIRGYDPDGESGPQAAETVILSGMDLVVPGENGLGNWELINEEKNIWAIQLTANHGMKAESEGRNLVFLGGHPYGEARWPNGSHPIDFDFRAMALSGENSSFLEKSGASRTDFPGTFFTGRYEVSGLPVGNWAGARIDLAPGSALQHLTGIVTSNSTGSLSFQYRSGGGGQQTVPGDRFFLWNSLLALDQPGEAFFDVRGVSGPSFRLYLIPHDGENPGNKDLEMRVERTHPNSPSQKQNSVFHFVNSHYKVRDLVMSGGNFNVTESASNISLERVRVEYGSCERNQLIATGAAISLAGNSHNVIDSVIDATFGKGIAIKNSNGSVIRNCVVRRSFDIGIDTQPSVTAAIFEGNTAAFCGSHGFTIKARQSKFLLNNVFQLSMRLNDKAGMNTNSTADMQGTEIAYNWIHSSGAPLSAVRGIRFDSGNSSVGNWNYQVHHNCVWGLAGGTGITLYSIPPEAPIFGGDAQVKVYHNSLDTDLVLSDRTFDGALHGFDVRHNICQALRTTGADDLAAYLSTAESVSKNLFASFSLADNFTGNPGFRSVFTGNLQLSADSTALNKGDLIPPYTDNVADGVPDLGAYEFGQIGWKPGAQLLSGQAGAIEFQLVRDPLGATTIRTSNHPDDRILPIETRLRIGGIVSQTPFPRFLPPHYHVEEVFPIDLGSLEGTFEIEWALDGENFSPTGKEILIAPPNLLQIDPIPSFDPTRISAETGGTIVFSGSGFSSVPLYLRPVEMDNLLAIDLIQKPVPVLMDTSRIIAEGKMKADGSDLRFVQLNPVKFLDHWVESGLGTSTTLIWLRYADGTSNGGDPTIFAAYGDPNLSDISSSTVLTDAFPVLVDSDLLYQVRANALETPSRETLSSLNLWPNDANGDRPAIQSATASMPEFHRGVTANLPGVWFDGNDSMVFQNASEQTPFSIYVTYFNPDPGTSSNQRLVSSGPGRDFTSGGIFYNIHPNSIIDADSVSVRMNWLRLAPGSSANLVNLTLGRKAEPPGVNVGNPLYYRGYMHEMLLFGRVLENVESFQVREYLGRKWEVSGDQPRGRVDPNLEIPPLEIEIDGERIWNFNVSDSSQLEVPIPPAPTGTTLPKLLEVRMSRSGVSQTAVESAVYFSPSFATRHPETDPLVDVSGDGFPAFWNEFFGLPLNTMLPGGSGGSLQSPFWFAPFDDGGEQKIGFFYRRNPVATDTLIWLDVSDTLSDSTRIFPANLSGNEVVGTTDDGSGVEIRRVTFDGDRAFVKVGLMFLGN